jgi:signal transduction histidine kinase
LRDHREGLGLGLYICNEIAKAHGGTLEVASECGKTCFTLRMPMQEQQVVADQMEAVLF